MKLLTLMWNVLSLVVGTVVNDVGTVTVTTVSAVPPPCCVTAPSPPPPPPAVAPLVTPGGAEVETPLTGGHVNSVQSCFITDSLHTKSVPEGRVEEEEDGGVWSRKGRSRRMERSRGRWERG